MSLLPRPILPVLMYHRFGDKPQGDPQLWISPDQFTAQLRWLTQQGYRSLTLEEAHAALARGQTPRRSVLLTIDDGFATDLDLAAELLESAGARAAVFVPAGLIDQTVDFEHPSGDPDQTSSGRLASVEDLRRWLDRGFDVGCHSMTHRDLTDCEPDTLDLEVRQARDRISQLLDHPIDDFCYPFAHHDAAARAAVRSAGFRAAYAGEPPVDDLHAIARMMVYPRDDETRFRRKASGYYFWLSELHQKLRRFMGN